MSVYIIAEAGVNHNGDMNLAKKLIEEAANSGANAVKFQSFIADKLVTKTAERAKYQDRNTNNNDSQYNMLKKLELDYSKHKELQLYAKSLGIDFLSSAFDLESIDLLEELEMPMYKIPSGEINNVPYLEKIAKTGKPIILSTGMCYLADIEFAIHLIKSQNNNNITILHCSTEYPTPMEDVNLKAMNTIESAFNYPIGYSDHTEGIIIPIAAVARGAKIIEKHFTLDKNMEGPDHKASLEPEELKNMVDQIRALEVALGDGIKKPSSAELENMKVVRKSIVASQNINKGERFSEENLTLKRPGTGINPKQWYDLIGKESNFNYQKDEFIKL
ncbi:N-acetylneuraminate synthase [Macrococcoides canis]|uniref:N-acetylneuraminate synthase n=1 Tax=Macrococcoides canis TaxID=1855823 RepID=UPI0020B7EBDA|nr:N-acetylneuraminate synthase [Macrococcus canis]UTH00866.1 N-acetylneuraminate synthase [Macrococcus canis]UTH03231.1 N-acetylneuraminate synthase [Macrococcus canis]